MVKPGREKYTPGRESKEGDRLAARKACVPEEEREPGCRGRAPCHGSCSCGRRRNDRCYGKARHSVITYSKAAMISYLG